MTAVTLHQVAPWNDRLRNPYRTRFAEAGGRYFRVEADLLNAPWFVYEIDQSNDLHLQISDEARYPLVAMVFTLAAARLAIRLPVDGATEDEIDAAVAATRRVTCAYALA